jgi:hypothetical protein
MSCKVAITLALIELENIHLGVNWKLVNFIFPVPHSYWLTVVCSFSHESYVETNQECYAAGWADIYTYVSSLWSFPTSPMMETKQVSEMSGDMADSPRRFWYIYYTDLRAALTGYANTSKKKTQLDLVC